MAYGHTTVTSGTSGSSGSQTCSVAEADRLNVGRALAFKQHTDRYDPHDPSTGQIIEITAIAGSSVTATLGAGGTTARSIGFGYFIVMLTQDTEGIWVVSTWAGLTAAILAANSAGGGEIIIPPNTAITSSGTPITPLSTVTVRGLDRDTSVLKLPASSTGSALFAFAAATVGTGVALSGNAARGSISVSFTAAVPTGLAVGDFLWLTSAGYRSGAGGVSELKKVKGIVGTTVTFEEALEDSFLTSHTAQGARVTGGISKFHLENLTLDANGNTGAGAYGLSYAGSQGFMYESTIDVKTKGFVGDGATGAAVLLNLGYRNRISIEDQGSGGSSDAAIGIYAQSNAHFPLVSSKDSPTFGILMIAAHGCTGDTISSDGAAGRAVKFQGCSGNEFGVCNGTMAGTGVGVDATGVSFTLASHHNVVGAVRSDKCDKYGVWFDGGEGGSSDSAWSSDYNAIGAASAWNNGTADIFVGTNCVGNSIGAANFGTLSDSSTNGKGLVIGSVPKLQAPVSVMVARDGTPSAIAMAGTNTSMIARGLDDSSTESLVASIVIPPGWASGAYIVLEWTQLVGGAGNVYWRYGLARAVNGATLDVAFTSADLVVAAPTQYLRKRTVFTATRFTVAPGEVVSLLIARIGGDAADTFAGDASVVSVGLIPG